MMTGSRHVLSPSMFFTFVFFAHLFIYLTIRLLYTYSHHYHGGTTTNNLPLQNTLQHHIQPPHLPVTTTTTTMNGSNDNSRAKSAKDDVSRLWYVFFLYFYMFYLQKTMSTAAYSTTTTTIIIMNGTTSKQKAQENDVDISWVMGNNEGTKETSLYISLALIFISFSFHFPLVTNIFIGTTQLFSDNNHLFH